MRKEARRPVGALYSWWPLLTPEGSWSSGQEGMEQLGLLHWNCSSGQARQGRSRSTWEYEYEYEYEYMFEYVFEYVFEYKFKYVLMYMFEYMSEYDYVFV